MKTIFRYLPLMAAAALLTACQNNDERDFSNKAYIDASAMTTETLIKGEAGDVVKTLSIATSRPAEQTIHAKAVVDKSLVDTYNKAYYSEAQMLPEENYEVTTADMVIDPGSVKSTEAAFTFKQLSTLDRATVFVLPVTVQTDGIDILASAKNYYYVFKAGALINVVCDTERNWLQVYPWSSTTLDRVKNIKQITMEALLYPREFGKLISTVMGIEGAFLWRIGDAGIPDNQIQIATSNGNVSDAKLQLETNKWTHCAITFDSQTGAMKFYINTHLVYETTKSASINIVGNGTDRNFLVGKSYDDARWFSGYMSELRVWDVIRTPEEIAASVYSVDPTTPGLLAYWKFDDQSSFLVKDYSGNGNDLKVGTTEALKWKNVSLPE